MQGRRYRLLLLSVVTAGLGLLRPTIAEGACCYFSAKDHDILQPAQKVFITWDPQGRTESFTVQPKFEGNALDFGMVIPTPSQPKLHEMPRDFFKHLAVYSILKRREFPQSRLLWEDELRRFKDKGGDKSAAEKKDDKGFPPPKKSTVEVIEGGIIGSLDYKILRAGRADDLFEWLKANRYHYSGDEATLNFYVQKRWLFTVMKIDTKQMKKNKDGSYNGEVTPTRFTFSTDKLVYPLKITQISVKDKTEALFYVQAPFKVDLPGDHTYQYQWVPMLQTASGCTPGGLPGKCADWLKAIESQIPALLKRSQELGYTFVAGQRPRPNARGRTPTTIEWARKLTARDIDILTGDAPYGDRLPNIDEGYTVRDLNDAKRGEVVRRVLRERLEKARKERPQGYLLRAAPADDLKALRQLVGHLRAGLFVTKFRKIFTRDEMNDDLLIVAARLGQNEDSSEHEEIFPTTPP
ncbi:MAG: DUF2330 domain-containing protein [Gemmataceae bacterium]|nr:DUF2330 domain-containing protein [Gemmataceae bacterium]